MTRVDMDPAEIGHGMFYFFLNAVIVPRPIAWVSTRSSAGIDNLAPHSFFTVSSVDPPVVQFTSVGRKDSLTNIEQNGEFVVSFTPAFLIAEVNATGTDFPSDISEFDAVGLEREDSLRVAPPRVAASPVVLECTLHSTVSFGRDTVIFGRVVHAAISDSVLRDGRPAIDLLQPISRLGGNEWGHLGRIDELTRIGFHQWPGHFQPATNGRTRS
ncbi:MAG TPA: flavin reductase family protein [Mycobacterium sp.]|nr:flavin reductase family protein [Mycobacterium sp.]HUH69836.1 flavin reductase family protein [Mycobacterium sp.]